MYSRAPSAQAEAVHEISFRGLVLPNRTPPHTALLDLDPLPLSALGDPDLVALYQGRFTHFNPIQTQVWEASCGVFHALALDVKGPEPDGPVPPSHPKP